MVDDNQINYLSEYNAHIYINKKYSENLIDILSDNDMYTSTVRQITDKFSNLIKEHLNNKYNLIHEKSKTDDMYEYKRYYYKKDLHFENIYELEKHFNINQYVELKNKEVENQKTEKQEVKKETPKLNITNTFIKRDIISIIKDNVEIIDYAKNIGLTPVRQGNDRYSLKEYDSVVISPSKRKYIRNSTGDIGKSVIDFAMEFRGLSLKEAIVELKKYVPSYYLENNNNSNNSNNTYYQKEDKQTIQKEKEKQEKQVKGLVLPTPSLKAHKKMFAYLGKSRMIDKQVIDTLYKRKMIFQDEKGNISFVGYNKENKADFVFQRGTNTNKPFKKVVSGSNFETAFFVDNNSDSIFITEAIIDNMSIMTMLLHNNTDFTKYNYLSLCGTCTKSINTYIKDNEKISTVYICVDNDTAGETLREKIDKMLKDIGFKGEVIHKRPINKDFNEDLQKLKNEVSHKKNNINKTIKRGISHEL